MNLAADVVVMVVAAAAGNSYHHNYRRSDVRCMDLYASEFLCYSEADVATHTLLLRGGNEGCT